MHKSLLSCSVLDKIYVNLLIYLPNRPVYNRNKTGAFSLSNYSELICDGFTIQINGQLVLRVDPLALLAAMAVVSKLEVELAIFVNHCLEALQLL